MGKLAERIKRRYRERAPEAAEEWLKACKETDVDPIQEALKAYDDWKKAMQQALKEDRLKKVLELMSKTDWLKGVEEAGEESFRHGVEAKAYKHEAFADAFEDVYLKAKEEAKKLPKGVTPAEKAKRVEKVIEILMANKGVWRQKRRA